MKIGFILLLSFCSLSVYSLDSRKDHRRSMQDLMYQPIKGTFFIDVDFLGRSGGLDTKDSSGVVTQESDTSRIELDAIVGFAITHDFYLGVGLGYLFDDSLETKSSTSGLRERNSSGVKDPSIAAKLRMGRQKVSMFDIDLSAEVSPSFTDGTISKSKSSTNSSDANDGNALRGGTNALGLLELGQKYVSFSWMVYGGVDYTTERTLDHPVSGVDDTKFDSQLDFLTGGAFKFNFTESLSLDLGAFFVFSGEEKETVIGGTTSTTSDSSFDWSLEGKLNIEVIDKNVMFAPLVGYTAKGSRDVTVSTGTSTSVSKEVDRSEFYYGLNALFQF